MYTLPNKKSSITVIALYQNNSSINYFGAKSKCNNYVNSGKYRGFDF